MESRMVRPKSCARSPKAPTNDNNAADSSPTSSPAQQPPSAHAFGYSGTRVAARRSSWRPEQHDSPHRPSLDSTPKETQAVSHSTKPDTIPPLHLVPPAINAGLSSVQPPRTPQGRATYTTCDDDGGLSAAQRVRMELSGSRAGAGSRANSSEDIFASRSPSVYDEKKNGPRSCPSTFNDNDGARNKFPPGRKRQVRGGELVVSKLLPTRDSVNSLLSYLHELQISEASLRKQLMKTKRHTEDELYQSLSKFNELQRTMQEVERNRQVAEQRLEEKEKRIRELARKLEKAEATQARSSPIRRSISTHDGLPPIEEEDISSHTDTETLTTTAEHLSRLRETKMSALTLPRKKPPALTMDALLSSTQPSQTSALPLRLQAIKDESTHFANISPRSPNRPLWDPWASGGATPMKNLPPVFTMGPTGLDAVVASPSSTDQRETTKAEVDELKSVLSPRQEEGRYEAPEHVHPTLTEQQYTASATPFEKKITEPHYATPIDSTPLSLPYQQHQDFNLQETQETTYSRPLEEAMSVLELPSRANSMLHIGAMPPIHESPYEQHEERVDTKNNDDNGAEWGSFQEDQASTALFSEPTESNDGVTPSFAASHPAALPLQSPIESSPDDKLASATPCNASAPDDYVEIAPVSEPEVTTGDSAHIHGLRMEEIPSKLSPPKSEAQPHRPASPANTENKSSLTGSVVSLEILLVEFFTEVDKKRLSMAKVYGKRYVGREKWLFAELAKRYGAKEVSRLKARYEKDIAIDSSGNSKHTTSNGNCHPGAESSGVLKQQKVRRLGHPRHPQFFHPPMPGRHTNLNDTVPPAALSVAPAECDGDSHTPTQSIVKSAGSPTKIPLQRTIHSPLGQRFSGENDALVGHSPSIPPSHETSKDNATVLTEADTSASTVMEGPPPLNLREESNDQVKRTSPSTHDKMENSNSGAHLDPRKRHNASGPTAPCQKNHGAELPAVTLEGLLKELYRNHQPDKLKNVSAVAKEYAGKERELVGLLKGKYGALSVKRLEENLEVLERAHHARMGGKGKKRGCFIRTVSLVFWLSVLLYFSFGAVFVSFVVLDAWECRALDSDDPEQESAEECVSLKKELEAFTYERVADYISLSHPEACFCSEWKSRENALFTTFSGEDFVNLARLVPFSPESFGAPWIMSVKEQVPSQEFYDSYAKPVVDLSLDVGSFVWSSVLELAGYDEASVEKSPVVEDVLENDAVDNLPVEEEIESDVNSGSLEQSAEEVETDRLVSEEGTDSQLTEDAEVETDALHVAGVLEQPPLEEDTAAFEDDLKMDEAETDASAIDDVAEESVAPVEEVSVEEESYPVTSEVKNVVDSEDHATVESIDMLESEDIRAVEEYEPIPDIEEDSVDLVETEVEGAQTEDDSTSGRVEEIKTVDGDDGTASAPVETDVADVAAFGAGKEAPEIAVEESDEHAVEDVAVESEDDVVEIEMRQEGLDLSYSETETEADATEEVLHDGSVDVLSSSPGEENEPALHVDEEVVSTLVEGETEEIDIGVQSEDASVSTLEGDSEAVVESTEEGMATPSDVTEQKSELEPDVSAPSEVFGVEVENAEVELGNVQDVEMEASPEFREENEPVVENVDGDLEALVLNWEDVDEMGAASSLREESMLEVGEDEVDIPSETDPTEMLSVEEVNASEEDQGDVLTEEESAEVMEVEVEASPSSIDGDREGILSEESSSSSIEEPVANDSDDVDAVSAASVKVEEPLLENGDAIVDEEGAEVVTNNAEDESAILSDAEAATIELEVEDGIADVLVDDVEERQVVEDIEEAPTASADIEADAVDNEADEQLSSPDTEEEAELHHDDAKLTTLSEIEAEQSASEVDLVSELSEEAVAIEAPATETSVDADTVSAEPSREANEQLVEAENSSGSVAQRSIPDAVADRTPEVDDLSVASKPAADAVDASDAISGVGSLAGLPAVEISVVTADVDEDEEIAFMEEFEDPDEVLRMAEQAAAAELSTMESR